MTFTYYSVTPGVKRPIIPIALKSATKIALYWGLIDSGADYCIFSLDIAKALGVSLAKEPTYFSGVGTEPQVGYWGKVDIRIGHKFYGLKALFSNIQDFGHGILGHQGFFDHFDVQLSYHQQTIEIIPVRETN